jgi:hypothetical protein
MADRTYDQRSVQVRLGALPGSTQECTSPTETVLAIPNGVYRKTAAATALRSEQRFSSTRVAISASFAQALAAEFRVSLFDHTAVSARMERTAGRLPQIVDSSPPRAYRDPKKHGSYR